MKLAARAGVTALAGGATGALAGWAMDSAGVPLGIAGASALAVLGGAGGAAWWASRQARTLRGAVSMAETALAGRSLLPAERRGSDESASVAHAVRALVARAEQSTRELSQRQAYAAVGDFATELVRELAPAVTTARSSLRALEGGLQPDSPFQLALARAQRELHRVSNTLQDTLRLARSGRLASRRLDLWQPLRNALRTVGADAAPRGIRIESPPHGRAPIWVFGDTDALEGLFINLLLNAVQASAPGATVQVEVAVAAERADSDVVVTVTDTGCGIPDGALDRVFEPFYTTKGDRAGLGLAIAWRTAAAHGGKLSIESALGRGTTVQVAMPRSFGEGSYELTTASS